MKPIRVLSVVFSVGIAIAAVVTAATVASAPTITLEKAVHFTSPSGEDVVIGPGTYEVEAVKEGLRLTPKDGKAEDAKVIQANPTPHPETIHATKAVAESLGEDALRVALRRADGTGFEAVGSFSGVRSRGVEGPGNTAYGQGALAANTTGEGNTAVGVAALAKFNRCCNTAVGANALAVNDLGQWNTALGAGALQNDTGGGNTALGSAALWANRKGEFNLASGWSALLNNKTGNYNTALGYAALSKSTGHSNTAVGSQAGSTLTAGDHNIYLNHVGVAPGERHDPDRHARHPDSDLPRGHRCGWVRVA